MPVRTHPRSIVRNWRKGCTGQGRTTHLSNEAASAPELDTSSLNPFRFKSTSWSFSKFVFGGGKCRLVEKRTSRPHHRQVKRQAPQYSSLREHFVDFLGHAHVGEQHKLFHQAVRLSQFFLLDVDRIRGLGRSKMDFDFGRCKIQRAGCHTLCLELDGKGVEKADGLRDRVGAMAYGVKLSVTPCMQSRTLLTGRLCEFVPPRTRTPLSKQ